MTFPKDLLSPTLVEMIHARRDAVQAEASRLVLEDFERNWLMGAVETLVPAPADAPSIVATLALLGVTP